MNRISRTSGLALALLVCGCDRGAVLPASANALDPIRFFIGHTHGEGRLDKLFGTPVTVIVESVGRRDGDTLILEQSIQEGAKPQRKRRWTMRPIAPGLYSGTLTEAVGPVSVAATGARAHIRYTMKGGLKVDQQLALQSDGKTVLNRLEVRKFGVKVATLSETIRKLD